MPQEFREYCCGLSIEKGTKNLTLACGSGPLLGAKEELNALVEQRTDQEGHRFLRAFPIGDQRALSTRLSSRCGPGEIELEVYPMGTLCEKYRMAGAGIPACFMPVGAGSMVEDAIITNIEEKRQKRETRVIDGQTCILEYALKPDFALVHANAGDPEGNLCYRKTAWNFNHVMAMAARVTIAEVENLVSPGDLKPESVHTPGIFVKRVLKFPESSLISRLCNELGSGIAGRIAGSFREEKTLKKFEGLPREIIALRVSQEIEDNSYVNLGIGIPTLVSNWLEGRDVILQSEIGMLKTGSLAEGDAHRPGPHQCQLPACSGNAGHASTSISANPSP